MPEAYVYMVVKKDGHWTLNRATLIKTVEVEGRWRQLTFRQDDGTETEHLGLGPWSSGPREAWQSGLNCLLMDLLWNKKPELHTAVLDYSSDMWQWMIEYDGDLPEE